MYQAYKFITIYFFNLFFFNAEIHTYIDYYVYLLFSAFIHAYTNIRKRVYNKHNDLRFFILDAF